MEKTLTIFTPTYNRGYCLSNCYQSIVRQSLKDFIWMVIDDGSDDNTRELVNEWKTLKNDFEIIYYYKENGGIHTAFNVGYEMIGTELCMCLESDDYLTDDAVETIIRYWQENKSPELGGMIALNCYPDGMIVGTRLPDQRVTHLNDFYHKGGKVDKKLIYRTVLVKLYPEYPVFEGEKFVYEGYKFLLIDQDYTLLILNKPICIVSYLKDGYTKNFRKVHRENPKGVAFSKRNELCYEKNILYLIKLCIQYSAYSMLAKNFHFLKESPKKILTLSLIPIGFIYMLALKLQAWCNL